MRESFIKKTESGLLQSLASPSGCAKALGPLPLSVPSPAQAQESQV